VEELEEANVQLRAELDAARLKMVELDAALLKMAKIQRCKMALTSTYGDLKKDFENLRLSHAAAVAEKTEVEKTESAKLQRFRDSLRKRLAELRRDTEASVVALRGRCAEFPTSPSMFDLLEWFRAEVTMMPTAFVECNENNTCYALIGIFQMLAGEGCKHLPELKELVLSCNALVLQDFPREIGWIAKRLVKNWWTKHGLSYCMQKIEEENRVSFTTCYFWCINVYH
jgi:hypothetical protein